MLSRNIEVRKRITALFFIVFALFSLLCIRLIWLQLVNGTWYQQQATENRIREVVVEPKRGVIYDRNGNELAVSISVNAVYAVPAEIKKDEVRRVASQVAQVLGMKDDDVYELLTRKQHSVWIKLNVDQEQSRSLRLKHLSGIGIIPKPQRFYPKKNLASHILGIAGEYNQGLEGIESAYDKVLSGINGRLLVEYDAAGHEIPGSTHRFLEPEQGLSVVLTIDQTIQYIAERELDKIVEERHPKSAAILVIEPNTGELLAVANRPDFDPNHYQDFPAANRRNVGISNSYESGSTFKIVTLSAALDAGVVSQNDHFYDPGYAKVGSQKISCWLPEGHGSEILTEVVQNSCNPGFVTIGLRVGTETFYKYLRAFGLGAPLGIDLSGEASGILMRQKDVKPIDLACMSIGQVNTLTPLQLVNAMSVVANGGKLMRPYLVKELRNSSGKVVKEFKPEMIRQVITKQTATEVQGLLEKVVSQGTGKNAFIEGYTVGGKTGTAQKPVPGGGYSATDHVASFLGFAPVEKPRLAVLVVIDSPQGYPYFGGTIAAPAFREVVRDSLRYLGEPLHYQPNELTMNKDMAVVPTILNLSLRDAQQVLEAVGLTGTPVGEGNLVYGQVPVDGVRLKKGSAVLLNMRRPATNSNGERLVPNLKGKTMRDVAELLGLMGLELEPEGEGIPSGVAVEQNPAPGVRVTSGTQVKVKFQSLRNNQLGP